MSERIVLLAQRTPFDPSRPVAPHGSAAHVAATYAALAGRYETEVYAAPIVPALSVGAGTTPVAARAATVRSPRLAARAAARALLPARLRGLRHDLALLLDDRRLARRVLADARARPPVAVYARSEYLATAGLRVARRLGVPLVLEVNGLLDNDARTMYRSLAEPLGAWLERRMLRRADELIAGSHGFADLLVERGAPPERITVIANAVAEDSVAPTPAEQRDGGDVTVVWIGHLMPWHLDAVGLLVEAAPEVLRRAPGARFLVVGGGPGEDELRSRVAELDLGERFAFTGTVPRTEVPGLLARCHAGIIPAVFDYAFPVKLVEMGAVGLPVATPRSASLDRLLEPGHEYLPFAPGDRAALVDALVALVTDRALRERLGRALHEAVRTRYTWPRFAEATEGVVERARARSG